MRLARRLLLALWAGLLVAVGALVAPTLFSILANRLVAGRIAAELFRRTTLLSIGLGLAILALGWDAPAGRHRGRRLLPLVPAALLVLGEFGVRPFLEAARLAAGPGSSAFIAWHGVAAAIYLLAMLSAVGLLVEELRRPD